MYTMQGDMQGSSVAVGSLLALTRLEAPYPIDCWLAITENQIGPNAFRPQEIVRALNGVTIQVVHSDAEGRMVLADTLTLASREKPRFVLDFATLTGACVAALGTRVGGVMGTDDALKAAILASAGRTGEPMWPLPLPEELRSKLDSTVADLQHKGDQYGGAGAARRTLPRTAHAAGGGGAPPARPPHHTARALAVPPLRPSGRTVLRRCRIS